MSNVEEVLSVQDCRKLMSIWDSTHCVETLIAAYTQKKLSKEVPAVGNEPLIQQMVDESKLVEWTTLIEKGAIKVHTGKKAAWLKSKYPERFMGSRFVIVRKPLEENLHINTSDPSSFRIKSRWCLQGHLDPDLDRKLDEGLLQSPTLSQMGRMILMQLISSFQWDLQLGDIKGAFLEAGPLPERFRPLFARQPQGGIPGVEPKLFSRWLVTSTDRMTLHLHGTGLSTQPPYPSVGKGLFLIPASTSCESMTVWLV